MVTQSKISPISYLPAELEGLAPSHGHCEHCGQSVRFDSFVVLEYDEIPTLITCSGECSCGQPLLTICGKPDLVEAFYQLMKEDYNIDEKKKQDCVHTH